MEEKATKKTPLIQDADLVGGEVLGLWKLTPVAVKLRDGYGKEILKLAVLIPGDTPDTTQMFYLEDNAVVKKPAQSWVKKQVLAKLGVMK